jgi:hypothetical protein
MLFNFNLTPLENVQPWGRPDEKRLHWFGLTDGEYWIQVGNEALFEYSEHARYHLGSKRYCNYQVVRLYEDLMEMTPYVLEAVPVELIPYISGSTGRIWSTASESWFAETRDHNDRDQYWEIVDASATWIGRRRLDTAYLLPSANIHLWSDAIHVFFEWDNREKLVTGAPAWVAQYGAYRLPREEFIAEVKSFHTRLMEQMSDRVEQVLAGALPSDIDIDLFGLQQEHLRRCRLIDGVFADPPIPTDWQRVQIAIHEIERGAYDRRI